jgi:hypothetical protein
MQPHPNTDGDADPGRILSDINHSKAFLFHISFKHMDL